ncbi:hypothetical protein [Pseudoxanthomonas suwonensis]|uniref:Uncharacterized protein n=1 Tax=Pseudoxanthomonas suwonensis TaxID=314722 RepID=A0A0E3Z056_9GAMM|nr:hypothetical protein [Pseudoxanthomonas suwonensis]AKC85854.1 hypothetical protein WQ53_02830 [Pseudoxanthomonas suwonensis]
MSGRRQLDAEIERLARMLPPWLARLRHPAQFWPQFDALAREILEQADVDQRPYVLQRLQDMLEENGIALPRAGRPLS